MATTTKPTVVPVPPVPRALRVFEAVHLLSIAWLANRRSKETKKAVHHEGERAAFWSHSVFALGLGWLRGAHAEHHGVLPLPFVKAFALIREHAEHEARLARAQEKLASEASRAFDGVSADAISAAMEVFIPVDLRGEACRALFLEDPFPLWAVAGSCSALAETCVVAEGATKGDVASAIVQRIQARVEVFNACADIAITSPGLTGAQIAEAMRAKFPPVPSEHDPFPSWIVASACACLADAEGAKDSRGLVSEVIAARILDRCAVAADCALIAGAMGNAEAYDAADLPKAIAAAMCTKYPRAAKLYENP